jgi:2-methylisocitrate lyase-like PEP mutase family enzyme
MATLRQLFATQEYVFAPLCYDPLTARLAEEVGFQAAYLGGGSYGYTLTWTEAMLTVTELADMTHRCCTAIDIPLVVDAACGFGEPLHVMRTVREIEQAGGAAIEIEDQYIPKRAHHHKGIEHMISQAEMVDKVRAACEARRHQDFVIIARTNAVRNTSMADAIARGQAYREAGADVIFASSLRTLEQIDTFAKAMEGPLMLMTGAGGLQKWGRTAREFGALGYTLLVDPSSPLLCAYQAARRAYESLRKDHSVAFAPGEIEAINAQLHATIRLPAYLEIERRTVEKDAAP